MELSDTLSIIAAVSALVLTLNQISATRNHNYLSVKPFLRFGWSAGESDDGIWIKNVGLGPAIITSFHIIKDGKELTTKNIEDQLYELGFESRMTVIDPKAIMQKSEKYWIVRSKDKIDCGNDQEKFWNCLEGVKFKINYESFYNISLPEVEWVAPNPTNYLVRGKPKQDIEEPSNDNETHNETFNSTPKDGAN
ncbi:MAG: hypothetical protein AB2665_18715 [Candidatus Thiodiazotropha sp.]